MSASHITDPLAPAISPLTADRQDSLAADRHGLTDTLTLAEERVEIGVARRDTGGKRVRVVTDTVDATAPVELADETVEIERHPVGREIDAVPPVREEDGVTIVPVVEERAVIVMKLFLTEEIHIRRTRSTRQVEVPVTLRRQRAEIDALDPAAADDLPAT